MRKTKNSYRDSSVSTLPKKISQKLIDIYRLKLFSKIKDSLETDRTTLLNKEELEYKKWLENKNFINTVINNSWFIPYIRA
ncbi:hypothetical protein [Aliarcobacter butzleri]|uniref:hypothetical protein n=1 Tax=Aliarcobacter TaxID=2321111 RepID=UPI002B246072|nr:hypothetical protein [Aliarcobacter butzleri]